MRDLPLVLAQPLLQLTDPALIVSDGGFVGENLAPFFQELLLQLSGRVGMEPIRLGHLSRRLVALRQFQNDLKLELYWIPFCHDNLLAFIMLVVPEEVKISHFSQSNFWGQYPFKALPKVEPILVYLLLNQDGAIQRDVLAYKLWPDVPEKKARERLRRHLYDLRSALPPFPDNQPWLLVDAKTVQWNPASSYWLDVAAFEHFSQQPHRLAEATALYTGALLPNFDESWLLPLRQRLQSIFEQVLSQLINQSWQAKDYRQAIRYCQQLLAEDAFNEEILRRQLALHYAMGNRGLAVASYHQF